MNDSNPARPTTRENIEPDPADGLSRTTVRKRIARLFTLGLAGVAIGFGLPALHADEKALFNLHCAPCHGKDGKARTPIAKKLGVKDLTESKLTDAEIEKQIIEGRKNDRGTQTMPPFKDKLTSDQIKSVISVVKSFRK